MLDERLLNTFLDQNIRFLFDMVISFIRVGKIKFLFSIYVTNTGIYSECQFAGSQK